MISTSAGTGFRVLIVEDDVIMARMEEAMLDQNPFMKFEVNRADTLVTAMGMLAKNQFHLVILDLTLPDSEGLNTFLAIHREAPQLPIIVVTATDDQSIALSAVHHGAQDYLVKTELNQDKLIRAITYALARSQNQVTERTEQQPAGQIVVLAGSKGGVGTSTIACHLSLELRSRTNQKVLLVDLDASTAVTPFLFRAQSKYSVLDAALNLQRLDSHFWARLVTPIEPGVEMLQPPGAMQISDAIPFDRVRHVLRFAQNRYSWVVVDLGRFTASSLSVLEDVNELLIITTPDLTAVHETKRLLARLTEVGVPVEKIRVILNRSTRKGGISSDQLKEVLRSAVHSTLSDCTDELEDAYSDGQFLRKGLKLRNEVGKLAHSIAGLPQEVEPIKRGVFRRWA